MPGGGSAVVYLLFIVDPLFVGVCVGTLYCYMYVVLYGKHPSAESWLLYFYCLLNVMSLLSFFASSSWCRWMVCSV